MRPLGAAHKQLAYTWLVNGRFRFVAKPLYLGLLNVELGAHRIRDMLARRPPAGGLQDVTAMVKTFERPRCLRGLIGSIKRLYPDLKIIVVDDGKNPQPLPGVTTHILPYDSGVGAGRSKGLSLVESKYVLNLDDDFVLHHRTGLHEAVKLMDSIGEIDIMGGMVVDLPLYIVHDYRGAGLFDTGARAVQAAGSRIGGLEVFDKVASFFLARTERLRLVDWDPGLKRLDHADFFSRAKGVLTAVFNPEFRTLHVRNPYDAAYLNIRHDTEDDLTRLRS